MMVIELSIFLANLCHTSHYTLSNSKLSEIFKKYYDIDIVDDLKHGL